MLTPGSFELILLQDEDEFNENKTDIDIEINECNLENPRQKRKGGKSSIRSKLLTKLLSLLNNIRFLLKIAVAQRRDTHQMLR